MGDKLPEGVGSILFLRDGWPRICVCKVKMRDGRVGVGVYVPGGPVLPETFDAGAQADALANLSAEPPDYSAIHEHIERVRAAAQGGQ